MALGVVTLFKGEPDAYVEEWLDWYARLYYVDWLLVFDNNDAVSPLKRARVRKVPIHWQHLPGQTKQWTAFYVALRLLRAEKFRWMFRTDLDEFPAGDVVLDARDSIPLQWKVFGPNVSAGGAVTEALVDPPVQRKAFVYRLPLAGFTASHIKTILRLEALGDPPAAGDTRWPPRGTFPDAHCARGPDGQLLFSQTTKGGRFQGPFMPENLIDPAGPFLYHYLTRSRDWWGKKIARGSCSTPGRVLLWSEYDELRANAIVRDDNLARG